MTPPLIDAMGTLVLACFAFLSFLIAVGSWIFNIGKHKATSDMVEKSLATLEAKHDAAMADIRKDINRHEVALAEGGRDFKHLSDALIEIKNDFDRGVNRLEKAISDLALQIRKG